MEHAHNAIPFIRDDATLFAIYNGHGGKEFAPYCLIHLPTRLKESNDFRDGNVAVA